MQRGVQIDHQQRLRLHRFLLERGESGAAVRVGNGDLCIGVVAGQRAQVRNKLLRGFGRHGWTQTVAIFVGKQQEGQFSQWPEQQFENGDPNSSPFGKETNVIGVVSSLKYGIYRESELMREYVELMSPR